MQSAPATVRIITDRLESTLKMRDGQALTLPAVDFATIQFIIQGKPVDFEFPLDHNFVLLEDGTLIRRVNVGAGDVVAPEVKERTI